MDIKGAEVWITGRRDGRHVTVGDLDVAVEAAIFVEELGFALPLKEQHARFVDGARVVNVRRSGETLVADLVNVPEELVERMPYVSAETRWPARFGGREFRVALTAVSLTDRPGCWGLADVRGRRAPVLYVRPTGEHGFESFVADREHALFRARTLLPHEPGAEWEVEALVRGDGAIRTGFGEFTEDGEMKKENEYMTYDAFVARNAGGERVFRGRVRPPDDVRLLAPAFRMVAPGSRLETDYIRIEKIVPGKDLVYDPLFGIDSNWQYQTGALTSIELYTAPFAAMPHTAFNSAYNYAMVPGATTAVMWEKVNPGFHTSLGVGTYTLNWSVRLYVSSHAGSIWRPALVLYTPTGSYVATSAPIPSIFTTNSLGPIEFEKWNDLKQQISISVGSAGAFFGIPGPWLIAPGVYKFGGSTCSWAVSYLDVQKN